MSISLTLVAPGQAANVSFTSNITGNSYTSNANGTIQCLAQDCNAAESAGFVPLAQKNTVTLGVSTAANVIYPVAGALNIVPASTVAALVGTIAAPTMLGQVTQFVSLASANVVYTASGCTIYNANQVACTTLTFNTGTMSLYALGSTTFQIVERSILSNSSNAVVYGIASS